VSAKAFREFARHYCEDHNSPVTPYSKFENRTEAPVEKDERPVLLTSFNNRDRKNRLAWCFVGEGWEHAVRKGEAEIRSMYKARKGVFIRGKVNR